MIQPETAIPEAISAALDVLKETIERENPPRSTRLRVASAVRRAIVPRLKPGKRDHRLDSAYADYRAGMRGMALFRKHIPNHDRLSLWRRRIEEGRLRNTLQKRAQRERKGVASADKSALAIVAPTIPREDGHPDNST